MTTLTNGKLPKSMLVSITAGYYLRADAAESWNAMRDYIHDKTGEWIAVVAAYRTLERQVYFSEGWKKGLPGFNIAAEPGTSNHGWGLAVDLASKRIRALIDKYGAKFGWAKKWSDAPTEWWHLKFNADVWKANRNQILPKPTKKYWYLTQRERRLALELEAERRTAKRNGGWHKIAPEHLERAQEIKRWFENQVVRIHAEAEKTGWSHANRKLRMTTLTKLIKG